MTGDTASSLTTSARLSLTDINLGLIRWLSVRAGGSSGTEVKTFLLTFCSQLALGKGGRMP